MLTKIETPVTISNPHKKYVDIFRATSRILKKGEQVLPTTQKRVATTFKRREPFLMKYTTYIGMTFIRSQSSSVGRASASHAKGPGFDPRLGQCWRGLVLLNRVAPVFRMRRKTEV